MCNAYIFSSATENLTWLQRFRNSDTAALNYVYQQVYQRLLRYGRRYMDDDEFALNTIVQDAILKGWEFRESMESMFHIYCFMRMNVKWKCLACYNDPNYKFHRRLFKADDLESHIGMNYSSLEEPDINECHHFDEERISEIYKVIPYLPPNRQTIVTLFFKYGLSYKRIANRFLMSNQMVGMEVQKGLEQIKTILRRKKRQVPAAKPAPVAFPQSDCMPPEMWHIFRFRYEMKMGFEQIATKMNLELLYVQRQYIEAHQKIRQLKASRV